MLSILLERKILRFLMELINMAIKENGGTHVREKGGED